MKKILNVIMTLAVAAILASCNSKEKVVIYSSMEDYRNEDFQSELNKKFPDYNVIIEHYSTGTHAAKIKAEGTKTSADIIIGLDSSYMESLKENFEHLTDYDYSDFVDDLAWTKEDKMYFVMERFSGSMIVNTDVLTSKGLAEPTSYNDLLKPEYKDQIMMPNPKTSGTGYQFLLQLVNAWGEEEAFSYFDKLSENMLQYTTNGSGPVNSLIRGEVAIAMGMTNQGVLEINKGTPLKIVTDPMGSPYSTVSNAAIKGRLGRKAVKDVFDYVFDEYNYRNNELFMPEVIYHSRNVVTLPNFPTLTYSDMTGINDVSVRETLLSKWEH